MWELAGPIIELVEFIIHLGTDKLQAPVNKLIVEDPAFVVAFWKQSVGQSEREII